MFSKLFHYSVTIAGIIIMCNISGMNSKSIRNQLQEGYQQKSLSRPRRSAFPQLSWTRNDNYGIVFVHSNEFSPQEIATIRSAAAEIAKFSCIPVSVYSYTKFLNFGSSINGQRLFRNHVFISRTQHSGCSANIGMTGGRQRLNLDPWLGCALRKGTVMHEMIHSLGFDHEQNRPDRNNFVRIHFDNIIPGEQYNFQMKPNSKAMLPYDFFSIMHYPGSSYARDPRYTTISSTLRGYSVPLFPLTNLSQTDKQKIRIITGCKNTLF